MAKWVDNIGESDIITDNLVKSERENVQEICKIDLEKYQAVTDKTVLTDEVVLTNNRRDHIKERRGLIFYEKYKTAFAEILMDPDFIFPDKKNSHSAIAAKHFEQDGRAVNIVVRLVVEGDDPNFKNSIITALELGDDRYQQFIHNNEPVYKKLDNEE